eukprot:Gb_38077 [translate_table: standard]
MVIKLSKLKKVQAKGSTSTLGVCRHLGVCFYCSLLMSSLFFADVSISWLLSLSAVYTGFFCMLEFVDRALTTVLCFRSNDFATTGSSKSAGPGSSSNAQGMPPQDLSKRDGSQMILPSKSPSDHCQGGEPMDSCNRGDGNGDETKQDRIKDFEVRIDLTGDLLHMVFSFLDHGTLCQAALVCKQWQIASVHEDFWTCLNFHNCRITTDQAVARMCHKYPRAVELHLPGYLVGHPVCESLCTLRNLEVLTLCRGTLGDLFFNTLVECPVLSRLSITESVLGTGGSPEIQIHHDSLHHLQLIKCRSLRIFVRCPQLQTLSLKRSGMASVALSCPLLQELDVASCHKLSDVGVRIAATSCPLLKSLDISNCSYVTDETLREIAAACTDLRALDASHCPSISLEAVRMLMLMDLRLYNCEGINASSMAALSQCLMLETLNLDFCWLLTTVTLDLPKLRHISIINCRKLVELNLHTPSLASMNVASCPILNRINITSTSLQKVVLHKQQSLMSMTLQCLHLCEVDLTECESLTNSICEVFSEGGGCPMLRTLILDGCESLTSVQLTSTSLHTLSLVSCRGVANLQLICPKLQKVYLDGCDRLEQASFCPVGLLSLNLGICPRMSKLEIEAPQMRVLELKGCGALSQTVMSCTQLLSIDASFCSSLKDDSLAAITAACRSVESLILMSCSSIGPEGLLSLGRISNLRVLDLSYTFLTSLQPIFESCPKLEILKLQACKYLENTALIPLLHGRALPKLCELDLSYSSLCQSAIEEFLAGCPHLTCVSLNGCANMHDLVWGLEDHKSYSDTYMVDVMMETRDLKQHKLENRCDWMDADMNEERCPDRSLQNLSCVGCVNIKKVVILASALCVNLSSLNLSLSANIEEVDLACINLTTLNLSNCTALKMLKLDCPYLTSLLLQGCRIEEHELVRAIQSCNLLETLDIRFCPKISLTAITKLRVRSPVLKRLFTNLSIELVHFI